ncbi:unnamed protein product, partial [Phaeothamnion confervicola]
MQARASPGPKLKPFGRPAPPAPPPGPPPALSAALAAVKADAPKRLSWAAGNPPVRGVHGLEDVGRTRPTSLPASSMQNAVAASSSVNTTKQPPQLFQLPG